MIKPMLLYTKEIGKLESRYVSLFDRTIKKGLTGVPAAAISKRVEIQFRSAGFKIELDNILNDLVLFASDFTDIELTGKAQAAVKLKFTPILPAGPGQKGAAKEVLPLTEELVKQSSELSQEAVASIIEMLKDEGIYELHPNKLAKRITEIWGGEKKRAVRFARTFSAEVANETALQRYKTHKVEAWRFRALIDDKTTRQCRMLHNTIFYTDSPEAARYRPPLHFHCRSGMEPIPLTEDIDTNFVFNNRDFTQLSEQGEYDPLTPDQVNKTFKAMDKYKEKYAIDKFILQEDIEKRLLKMKSTGLTQSPKPVKPVKPAKPKPVKPVKLTKNEQRVKDINAEIEALDIEKAAINKEYERVSKELDEIGYDPSNKEQWAKWVAKDKELGEIDRKWSALADKKDDLLRERSKLNQQIAKDLAKKQKKEKERVFFNEMPVSLQPKADEVLKQIPGITDKISEQGRAIVTKRLEVRNAQYELKEQLEREYSKLVDDALEGRITEEEFNVLEKELTDKLGAKIRTHDEEIARLTKAQMDNFNSTNKEIHKLLFIDEGEASKPFIKLDPGIKGSELEVSRQAQAAEAQEFFNRVMTKELRESLPTIEISELGKGGRAYTMRGENMVWLADDDGVDVLIHELGHNLEYNNKFMNYSAKKQLEDRTAKDKVERLWDLLGGGYDLSETTKKDKFFHPYVGKQYGGYSTEVTSMALQYLYKDPKTLYDKDPKLFTWVVNALRGHYRG